MAAAGQANHAGTRSMTIGLLVLLTGLGMFAAGYHAYGPGGDRARVTGLVDENYAKNTLLGQIVATGALSARPRPAVLDQPPPTRRGMLQFVPDNVREEPWPSTRLGRDLATSSPERDYVSIALDPRDWDDPEVGIVTNPMRRGESWTRGACVTFFSSGQAVTASATGLCVHGDTSRKHRRKSLRLLLTPRFGATMTPADIVPMALGRGLVLHSDRRRLHCVNPLGYELMRTIGANAPRTRPVRLIVNGELLDGMYFATEYLDATHFAARAGARAARWFQERDNDKPRDYRSTALMICDRAPSRMPPLEQLVDLDGALSWITGTLMIAPFDRQGVAYQTPGDPRWRWVAWDVDWGLGPWPERINDTVVVHRSVTEHLLAGSRSDIRASVLEHAMRHDPDLRRRLLQHVRATLDHITPYAWWQQALARYRAHAERLLDPRERGVVVRSLTSIDEFVQARPAELRRELSDAFELGPAHRVDVRVPSGAEVSIEGHRYDTDWTGYAFGGEEIAITVAPPFALRLAGEAAEMAKAQRDFRVTQPIVVEVVQRD